MRLPVYYQRVIKQKAVEFFGPSVQVYLFGSRVDDARKGGDIDLCIARADQDDLIRKKVKFLAALDRKLGEQKIDVLFFRNGSTSIERTALETGVRL
jgi:predicted nucleotidyltransferase